MKQIEKFAREQCPIHSRYQGTFLVCLCHEFIAGFRKARELAANFAELNGTNCGAIVDSDLFLSIGELEVEE